MEGIIGVKKKPQMFAEFHPHVTHTKSFSEKKENL